MSNTYFHFKQFTVSQEKSAMKVTTDSCLFGAWVAEHVTREEKFPRSILDIGSGTGLLSLMLAQKIQGSRIDAIEIDDDSFQQSVANVTASPWAGSINLLHEDAKEYSSQVKYDTIISNPPFYDRELKGTDKRKNIAHHDEGLLIPELLEIIKNNLDPGGSFYLLLPYKRNGEIRKLLTGHELAIRHMTLVRQTPAHAHFRIMLAGSWKSCELAAVELDELAIKDEKGNYTPAFNYLLKDYYLQL